MPRSLDCDADRRTVTTADGRSFALRSPADRDRHASRDGSRRWRIASIEIQYLRNVEDALRFASPFSIDPGIVIVGGGVIGLEAACRGRQRTDVVSR